MKIVVSELQIPNYQGVRVPAFARLYASETFTNEDLEVIVGGKLNSKDFYREVAASLDGEVITVDSFTGSDAVDSTVNDSVHNGVTYTLAIYDANGKHITTVYSGLKVSDLLTPTTWSEIEVYSKSRRYHYSTTLATWERVYALYNTIISGMTKATSAVIGATRLSVPAVSVADPIAVGNNDTRMVQNLADFSDSLSTAVSTIAALGNPQTVLTINRPTTIPATLVVPSNIKIDVQGTGLLTVAAGQTLTINSLSDAGNRQIFAGTGAVRLGKASVKEFNLAWWHGISASPVDATKGLTDIIASFTANGGGFCYAPEGIWTTTGGHILPPNSWFRGGGNFPTDFRGTTIRLATAGTYLFKIGQNVYNFGFDQITLDGNSLLNAEGIRCEGASPNTSGGLYLNRVQFANFTDGLRILSTSGSWQMTQVSLVNCLFINNSHSGYRCNTLNTQLTTFNTNWSIPANAYGIYGEALGMTAIIGGEVAGAGAGNNSTFINLLGAHVNLNISPVQIEGCETVLVNNASDISGIIAFYGCLVQGIIQLNETCTVDCFGCNFMSHAFRDAPGVTAVVTVRGGHIREDNADGGADVVPAKLDAFVGGSLIITEEIGTNGNLRYRLPMDLFSPAVLDGNPTTPMFGIGHYTATSEDKRLLRLGRKDINGNWLSTFYYDIYREFSTGLLKFVGAQADPFKGYDFNAAVYVPNLAYNETTWNGNTSVPTRNDVRDEIEALRAAYIAAIAAIIDGQVFTGQIAAPSVVINSGSAISKELKGTATLDFPSIPAQETAELTITVTGAATGDVAWASPNTSIEAGLVWSAYVNATNTVTIRLANVTVGAIDPASKSWSAWVRG